MELPGSQAIMVSNQHKDETGSDRTEIQSKRPIARGDVVSKRYALWSLR